MNTKLGVNREGSLDNAQKGSGAENNIRASEARKGTVFH